MKILMIYDLFMINPLNVATDKARCIHMDKGGRSITYHGFRLLQ